MEIKFKYSSEDLVVRETGKYDDGSPALQIFDSFGCPYATLTVNMGLGPRNNGEYLIKTWSENAPICSALLKSKKFKDTGIRVKAGFTEASVWKAQ